MDIVKVLDTLKREFKGVKPGEEKIISCPLCNSTMRLYISRNNGHRSAICIKDNVRDNNRNTKRKYKV